MAPLSSSDMDDYMQDDCQCTKVIETLTVTVGTAANEALFLKFAATCALTWESMTRPAVQECGAEDCGEDVNYFLDQPFAVPAC